LHRDIELFFQEQVARDFADARFDHHASVEPTMAASRSDCWVTDDIDWLKDLHDGWPALRSIVMIRAQRTLNARPAAKPATSSPRSLPTLASWPKPSRPLGHREPPPLGARHDLPRGRIAHPQGQCPHNAGILKHMALNMLKKTPVRKSIRLKRKSAGWTTSSYRPFSWRHEIFKRFPYHMTGAFAFGYPDGFMLSGHLRKRRVVLRFRASQRPRDANDEDGPASRAAPCMAPLGASEGRFARKTGFWCLVARIELSDNCRQAMRRRILGKADELSQSSAIPSAETPHFFRKSRPARPFHSMVLAIDTLFPYVMDASNSPLALRIPREPKGQRKC